MTMSVRLVFQSFFSCFLVVFQSFFVFLVAPLSSFLVFCLSLDIKSTFICSSGMGLVMRRFGKGDVDAYNVYIAAAMPASPQKPQQYSRSFRFFCVTMGS